KMLATHRRRLLSRSLVSHDISDFKTNVSMPGRSIVMAAFTGFWLPITIDPHPMMIFFNYLYRDAGNYKQHGSVVFGNPNNRRLNEVDQRIRAALIDGEFFVARHWGLPDLR